MFKKRILKGNLRAKTENPNGSEAGEESLLAKAVEIRDEQVERKR